MIVFRVSPEKIKFTSNFLCGVKLKCGRTIIKPPPLAREIYGLKQVQLMIFSKNIWSQKYMYY